VAVRETDANRDTVRAEIVEAIEIAASARNGKKDRAGRRVKSRFFTDPIANKDPRLRGLSRTAPRIKIGALSLTVTEVAALRVNRTLFL
jgi:hypothetical protein